MRTSVYSRAAALDRARKILQFDILFCHDTYFLKYVIIVIHAVYHHLKRWSSTTGEFIVRVHLSMQNILSQKKLLIRGHKEVLYHSIQCT